MVVTDLLKGVNLYLVGMMGSGKTTVGQILARMLHYRFLDTDSLIEQVAGESIVDIFSGVGESGFRELESKVLSEVAAYKNLVVATGGGIVVRRENWGFLRHGVVVWLDASVELLYQRVQEDTGRPLLRDLDPKGKLQQLLEQRQGLYSQADVRVPVQAEQSPLDVAERVIEAVAKALKPVDAQAPDLN